MAPKCIKCKSSIKMDRTRPGHFHCPKCGACYGFVGRKRIP